MDIESIRSKVKAFIYSIFGLFIVIVLFRIFLTLVDADATAQISRFWFGTVSQPFINPFLDIYPRWFLGIRIENAALLSIVTLFFGAVIFAKLATFFLEKEPARIVLNIVDLLFKIVEFVLLFRFILVLTGGDFNRFGRLINQLSFFVYEPFEGLLPRIAIGTFGFIELSTMVAIVFVIIFDIVSENIIRSMFGIEEGYANYSQAPTSASYAQPTNPQSQSNITINVGNQSQQPQNEPTSYQSFNPYAVGNNTMEGQGSPQLENPRVNQSHNNPNQGRS